MTTIAPLPETEIDGSLFPPARPIIVPDLVTWNGDDLHKDWPFQHQPPLGPSD